MFSKIKLIKSYWGSPIVSKKDRFIMIYQLSIFYNMINEYTAYFAAPVYNVEELAGVLIIEIPFLHLDTMLTQRAGLGQTGEMFLVGEDGLMRSNSRFYVEPTINLQPVP